MHFYTSQGMLALIGGLFLLSQGAAAIPQSGIVGTLTCAGSINSSDYPTISDCKKALAMVTPGTPEICTDVWMEQMDFKKYGSCIVHTYSTTRGKAHCLDGSKIIKGGNAIIASCSKGKNTGGKYQWATEEEKGEGVRLIKAKA